MKKGVVFKTVRVAVVLLAAVAVAVFLVKLRPRAEKQERPSDGRLVEVVRTRSQTLPMMIEAYGTVSARESLKLFAEAHGKIVAIHAAFVEGGFVTSGEVLATIDPRDYELALRRTTVGIRQAQAELERLEQEVLNLNASLDLARSDIKLAAAERQRLKNLAGKDMTSQSVLDKAERQYLNSRERWQSLENQLAITGPNRTRLLSQLEMATVAKQQALLDLARCRIKAPFDAWVTAKAVEADQHLTVGQAVGSLYRAGAFDIDVHLPMADLAWFPEAGKSNDELPAEVIFTETAPPKRWHGHVARIKAALDPTTRTLPVVIEVDTPTDAGSNAFAADRLKPGMFVSVRIRGREVANIHRLPRHLIRDEDSLFLAVNDRVTVRKVRILRRFQTTVLISAGLSDDDLVITTPLSGAVEGMKIRIQ